MLFISYIIIIILIVVCIVNGVLNLKKMSEGIFQLEKISFNIHELISDVMNLASVNAHPKNIEMNIEINSDIPEIVIGDPVHYIYYLY
jgi:signal transduction histidine kinase